MITLNNLTDMVIAQAQGAVVTDETKFTNELVQLLIHQARAELIAQMRVKSYPDILIQRYYPSFEEAIQINPCVVEFVIPDYINLGPRGDGVQYVGNVNEMEPFDRLGKGTQLNIYAAHRRTNPANRKGTMFNVALDETGYMKIVVRNNVELEEFVVLGIMANPTEATYYRAATDIYPVSGEMINTIVEIVSQRMYVMAQTPADTVSNSADTPSQSGNQIPTQRGRRR